MLSILSEICTSLYHASFSPWFLEFTVISNLPYDGNRSISRIITARVMATVINGMSLEALLTSNIFQNPTFRSSDGIFTAKQELQFLCIVAHSFACYRILLMSLCLTSLLTFMKYYHVIIVIFPEHTSIHSPYKWCQPIFPCLNVLHVLLSQILTFLLTWSEIYLIIKVAFENDTPRSLDSRWHHCSQNKNLLKVGILCYMLDTLIACSVVGMGTFVGYYCQAYGYCTKLDSPRLWC